MPESVSTDSVRVRETSSVQFIIIIIIIIMFIKKNKQYNKQVLKCDI